MHQTQPAATALIWEHDEPGVSTRISYAELQAEVGRLANVLTGMNVRKGDRVCLYMPMTPYAVYTMLACARIGAVHSVVFAGFSAEALRSRIVDARCKVVVTADQGLRSGKSVPLKVPFDEKMDISCHRHRHHPV
jgi:acetyl-CoA synthetase